MTTATKHNPTVIWRTIAKDVFQLTRATLTVPATYRMTVKSIDSNDIGSGQKETGYCIVDYLGGLFPIVATGTNTIDVSDIFNIGNCPVSGKTAIVFKPVGKSLFLGQEYFQFLHPNAMANSRKYDLSILWYNDPNTKKIPFTNSDTPKIENYQDDHTDPEDGTKTINYADIYGELPKIELFVLMEDGSYWKRQDTPYFTSIDGLLDNIKFDALPDVFTGYLTISR